MSWEDPVRRAGSLVIKGNWFCEALAMALQSCMAIASGYGAIVVHDGDGVSEDA